MKKVKTFKQFESKVTKVRRTIDLIEELSTELKDDDFLIDIYKGGNSAYYSLTNYTTISRSESLNDKIILIEITYNYYHQYIRINSYPPNPNISENNFKERVDDFLEDLKSFGLNIVSVSQGPWKTVIKVKKYTNKGYLLNESYNSNLIQVIPNKYVYHTSNPIFRDKISEEGLIPKGKSESWLSDTKIEGEVIFAVNSNNKRDWWNSTYDDDIYRIDTTELKNKWYNDPNFDSDNLHIITFESIPKNSIELIYKGTGESE
jgi:hypothetical protein